MKRILTVALALTACGDTKEEVLLSPPSQPTPNEQKSGYNFYQDLLNTTLVHETGHALGLIHPFDSVKFGHACRKKLQELHPDIEFPIRDYMKDKDTEYWDYSGEYMYDKESVMQYDVCRSGYIFDPTPSIQDISEVRALYSVFAAPKGVNLMAPITVDTIDLFRTSGDVKMCFVKKGAPVSLVNAVQHAAIAWSSTGFTLWYAGVCNHSDYTNKHTVRIDWFKLGGSLLGQSSIGTSTRKVTMRIAVDSPENYVVQEKSVLIQKGL